MNCAMVYVPTMKATLTTCSFFHLKKHEHVRPTLTWTFSPVKDAAMLNTGAFLLRQSPWSRDFLRRVWGTQAGPTSRFFKGQVVGFFDVPITASYSRYNVILIFRVIVPPMCVFGPGFSLDQASLVSWQSLDRPKPVKWSWSSACDTCDTAWKLYQSWVFLVTFYFAYFR